MRVYIAGPIAGYHNGNAAGFARAVEYLRSIGHYPVNPHDVQPHQHDGPCPKGPAAGQNADGGEAEHTAPCFMRTDMQALLRCDGIFLLNGWEYSSGARTEFEVARAAGLYLMYESKSRAFAIDADHLERQRAWSRETFGPGSRVNGVLDHIRKELEEIAADPTDVEEWVDVLILAFDGAWRAGHEPQAILDALAAKQAKNEARTWPDWRQMSPDQAIEHVRDDDPGCTVCGRDNRNGTHTALERTGHLSHAFTPSA